ncbi:unnamed protein product, partial [Adineta steineri]
MEFKSTVFHFSSFNERHSAVNIVRYLKETLNSLEIYDKIISITCDGGPNLIAACKKLDRIIKRIWCCGHRLHLVIVNGLGLWIIGKTAAANQTNDSLIQNSASTESSTTTTESSTTSKTSSSSITASQVSSDGYENSMDTSWNSEDESDYSLFDPVNDNGSENNVLIPDNANEPTDDEEQYVDIIDDNWSLDIDTNAVAIEVVEMTNKLLKKCRTIAKLTKKSYIVANFIRTNHTSNMISIDCKSRWNSTHRLIETIIGAKSVLMKLFAEKKALKLRKEQFEKLKEVELKNEDWELLKCLQRVLKPFRIATQMMSGKYYPSIGLAYHAIERLKRYCEKNDDDHNEHVEVLKKLLLTKINQYFYSDVEQLQNLQYHAYFDPAAHLSFDDVEKTQCEKYIRHLVLNDIYPQKRPSSDIIQASSSTATATASSSTATATASSSTATATASSSTATATTSSTTTSIQVQHFSSQNISSKKSIYDDFIEACGGQEYIIENIREKSKRICLNEELKLFKVAVQDFNLK